MNRRFGTLFLSMGLALMAQSLSADRPASRPRIYGISRVSFFSTDLLAASTFYEKLLDTKEAACSECQTPPARASLLVNREQLVSLVPAPNPPPSNLLLETVFVTDDLVVLRRYLLENKIRVVPETVDAHVTSAAPQLLSVTDPEGRHVGFVQRSSVSGATAKGFAMSPRVNGLHLIHAGFIVHDRAATEHFYKDILAFRPYWHGGMKDDGKDEWVSMQVPDGTDWLEFMVNVSPDADQRVRGIMNHIAIGVTDIHETEKRLKDAGVNLTEQPKIGRDGKWQLNLYDPDQTRVEFMEFTPVQKPCCSEFTGPHPKP